MDFWAQFWLKKIRFELSPMTGLYRSVHGTIIRTGGFLLKKLRCFEVMLSIYEFSRVRENVES